MEILRFMLLGIGTGGVYAMLAQGLVLVYRGSGLLNFSQGAIAMVGAFAYYECTSLDGLPLWAGVVIALALCGLIGALIQLVVLRQMRRSSSLSQVIATLGVTIVLQSAAYLRYGHDPHAVKSIIPVSTVHIFSGQLGIGLNLIGIFLIGLVLTIVLSVVYRRTNFGRVTTAVAEKQLVAATLGHSPDLIASVNWALGGVIACLGRRPGRTDPLPRPDPAGPAGSPGHGGRAAGRIRILPDHVRRRRGPGVPATLDRPLRQPARLVSAAPFIVVVIVLILRGQVLPLAQPRAQPGHRRSAAARSGTGWSPCCTRPAPT